MRLQLLGHVCHHERLADGLPTGDAQLSSSLCEDSFFLLLIHPQHRSYVWPSDPPCDCESGLRRYRGGGHSYTKSSKFRNYACCQHTLNLPHFFTCKTFASRNGEFSTSLSRHDLRPTPSVVFSRTFFTGASGQRLPISSLPGEVDHHARCQHH